jgi:hypothetical protein
MEVEKLLKSDFIYLVPLTDWVSNIVLVTKKQCMIHICIDYRDINRSCLKDKYRSTCNPHSAGGHGYIIVAVDYFTKWAEAMPTFNNTCETTAYFFLTMSLHGLVFTSHSYEPWETFLESHDV